MQRQGMQLTVRRWLQLEQTPDEEMKRLLDLNTALQNYGFKGDYLFILKSYEDYKRSSVYPFAGGRGEQPQWVLDDFDTLALLEEREWLLRKYSNKLPAAQQAPPTFSELFKRPA